MPPLPWTMGLFLRQAITSGSFEFQSKTVISASATVDLTLASSKGFHVFYLYDLVPATNAVDLWMRFSQSATWKSGASDYSWSCRGIGTSAVLSSQNGDSEIHLNHNAASWRYGTAAGESHNGLVCLLNEGGGSGGAAIQYKMAGKLDGAIFAHEIGHGVFIGNELAIDKVRFMFSSGNMASGTIYYYGAALT